MTTPTPAPTQPSEEDRQFALQLMGSPECDYPHLVEANAGLIARFRLRATEKLRAENEEQKAKLDYVHGMGLRFGMMKTSDKPEPYLAHVWDKDSDNERMFREWSHSIGWEDTVAALRQQLADAAAREKRLRENCRIVFYPPNNGYPIEHAPHAKKDQWDAIISALSATPPLNP